MKCVCKDPKCTTEVHFDALSKTMIVEREALSILVYLDPNTITQMMAELRRCLKAMAEGDVEV